MLGKLICDENKSLKDALDVLNANGKGMAFIVGSGSDRKLRGVLSDGDIRRLILAGHSLSSKIGELIKKDYVYAKKGEPYSALLAKTNDSVKIIPIVNDCFEVVDYFEYNAEIRAQVAAPDLRGHELKYLTDAFLSTWISSKGEYIERFEAGFSRFCDCEHGVAVSNGTVSLHLALLALGIGAGDEVIVPDLTFAATINTVLHANAIPVIVDIEKDSWCIDPAEIEKAITSKTKAIIPVHLYGQPADMGAIMKIARKHKLFVIEDCAEAHGAEFAGKKVSSFGDIGCFSFFGNKIITTGEGGMCVTNSKELAEKMRLLRDHGMSKSKKYHHEIIGYNYRLTNLQAAIGVAQLERIDEILAGRKKIEEVYKSVLSGNDIIEFQRNDLAERKKITWLVSVLVKNGRRDYYIDKMREQSLESRPFFYTLSEIDHYKKHVFSSKVSQAISGQGINFPSSFSVDRQVIEKIGHILK
jgi:perosamine synthetase